MDFAASLYLTGAEIGLSLTAFVVLLATAWGSRGVARLLTIVAVAALVGATIFTATLLDASLGGREGVAFGGLIIVDTFAALAKILIYVATIACLIMTPSYFARHGEYRGEYPALILLNAVGMGMMVGATNFMTLYIGLEMSSLASYVLASFSRSDTRSAEAGLKYFVLGSLSSGILLYGISLVYGFAGSTSYAGIREAFDGTGLSTGALFGIVFILAGAAFKIAAVPFHMWTPDVYEGSPTPVTAFFASAPKVAAMALLVRIAFEPFGDQADSWRQIVIFAALASIVVGALGAIGQQNLKRLLAYSSINNVGFVLIGLAAATSQGASSVLVYLFIYIFMTLGSFAALLILRDPEGERLTSFDDIRGLAVRSPALAWSLLILMFSLAGIPPLLGFWAKFVVFQAAVQADMVALAAIGIAASVIGAFYYIKFIKVMFFDTPEGRTDYRAPAGHWLVLFFSVLAVSPLGYFFTPWLQYVSDAAGLSLFGIA
ncbi:NADH-quinone oxidoreductase subunit NuoN [Qipengyuania sp.]|uniref:NADH-quinone oxidoreductase subunit NuoN n=1 Tax=Qipengyuania sp. TaxID=2004515 RepID=UPI0037369325